MRDFVVFTHSAQPRLPGRNQSKTQLNTEELRGNSFCLKRAVRHPEEFLDPQTEIGCEVRKAKSSGTANSLQSGGKVRRHKNPIHCSSLLLQVPLCLLISFGASLLFVVACDSDTHTQTHTHCMSLSLPGPRAPLPLTVVPGSDCCLTESQCASLSIPTSSGETAALTFMAVPTLFPFFSQVVYVLL